MLNSNDIGRQNRELETELSDALRCVLASGWFVLGEQVIEFEREFAKYCGAESCISLANGSEALELALRGLGVGSGGRVATVANAGGYASIAILNIGAVPVYMDVAHDDLNMDPACLANVMQGGIDAVIVTHLFGRLAPIEPIAALCAANAVPLIEDCAQAHGASCNRRRAGTFGTLGCFSFYPTKNLGALGDGGAIVTNDALLAERIRQLRQYGWGSKYHVEREGGRNSRLDELQAAFLRRKLPRLDGWNRRRREIAAFYASGIHHPAIHRDTRQGEGDVVHLYAVRSNARDSLRAHLKDQGIAADVHYPVPDHLQLAWRGTNGGTHLPVTELGCAELLTLPCFPEMTATEVAHVIAACNSWEVAAANGGV